jgi:lipopolysaccharide export system protein LptC
VDYKNMAVQEVRDLKKKQLKPSGMYDRVETLSFSIKGTQRQVEKEKHRKTNHQTVVRAGDSMNRSN